MVTANHEGEDKHKIITTTTAVWVVRGVDAAAVGCTNAVSDAEKQKRNEKTKKKILAIAIVG